MVVDDRGFGQCTKLGSAELIHEVTEMPKTALFVVLLLLLLDDTQLHLTHNRLITEINQKVMVARMQSIFDPHHRERLTELIEHLSNLFLIACTFRT